MQVAQTLDFRMLYIHMLDRVLTIEFFILVAVKVLVFLTMPVEPTSVDILQQIEYLWGLKSAITFSDIVPVIVSLLETPLENLERLVVLVSCDEYFLTVRYN